MKTRVLVIVGIVLVVGIMLTNLITHYNAIREFESNNIPGQLKGIFGSCACQERIKTNPDTIERCPEPFIDWQNSTHYIDNNLCKWVTSHQSEDISFDDFEEMNPPYNNNKIVESIVIIPKGAVIVENEHLIPKVITVVLGKNNTVTWINQDDTAHGIASDDASWGSPGSLKPGESFSVTFNSTGIYEYHGQPGPWITGKVIVINADSFSEINHHGTLYKDSKNSEKFEEYRILMQETQKEIASHILDIYISDAYVVEGWNFPFRDVSEITQMAGTDPVAVCSIPEKIPVHLQHIRESDMFEMFAGKYSQHQLTIDISDERYSGGLIHYDIITTSDDGLFSASTYFHLDSCTDEMKWPYFLLCKDLKSEEHTSTRIKSEIVSSLKNNEFCNVEFEPWHQDLRDYQAKISKEIDTLTQGNMVTDSQDDSNHRYFMEVQRLGLLNDIMRYYESEDSDFEEMQKDVSEYNKKFGSLPDELLEIIEKRK